MNRVRAYDLPLRIFHWLFVLTFLTSFTIGKFVDDESAIYAYHMLSGILMSFMVALRIIWGLSGSKTSRFSSFDLKLANLKAYFIDMFNTSSKRSLGHNPASSFAAVFMFSLAIFMLISGILMLQDFNKKLVEEIHEILAHFFLIIVISHITGVLFHQYRHKDGMMFSMISGKKESVIGENEIKGNYNKIAFLFIVLVVGFLINLSLNYNTQNGTLNLMGAKLKLLDHENHDHGDDFENDHKDDDDSDHHHEHDDHH